MIPDTSAMDKPVEQPRGLGRRSVVLLAAGGLALALLAVSLPVVRRWVRAERAVDAAGLRIAEVTRGDLERDVSAQGRVVAALHPTLFAPAQGTVAVLVKAGAQARKGEILARIDSPELRSRLLQERSGLSSLQSELERHRIAARQAALRSAQNVEVLTVRLAAARRAMGRAQATFDEGLLNRVDYEKAQDDVQLAEMDLQSARQAAGLEKETLDFEVRNRAQQVARQQAIVDEVQRQVDGLAVAAPFDGLVANVAVQDRDAVARDQAILTVVDLSAFEVEFDLPENYSADVAAGTPAEILYEGRPYPGRVVAVSPEVRDSQVRGTAAFAGETPAGLRQSQRVSVRLVFERRTGVVKVARGPFLESGAGRHAYVVDPEGGMAVRRPIAVGAVSVSEVEVTSGLVPGEQVVVSDTSVFEGAHTVLLRR